MSTSTSYLQVRIETRLKQRAEDVLEKLGLSTSEAVRLFLRQVLINKAIPFTIALKKQGAMNDTELTEQELMFHASQVFEVHEGDQEPLNYDPQKVKPVQYANYE